MNTNHTPGPWTILTEGSEDDCIVRTVMGSRKAARHMNEVACITTGSFDDQTEQANAKLIAAAPELLEVAQEFDKYIESFPDLIKPHFAELHKRIMSVIKKVTE